MAPVAPVAPVAEVITDVLDRDLLLSESDWLMLSWVEMTSLIEPCTVWDRVLAGVAQKQIPTYTNSLHKMLIQV